MIVRGAMIALLSGCWLLASLAAGEEPKLPAPGEAEPVHGGAARTEVFHFKHAKADAVSRTLRAVADALAIDVQVVADGKLNGIVVTASPEAQKRIAALIEKLDVPAVSTAVKESGERPGRVPRTFAPTPQKGDQQEVKTTIEIYRLKYAGAGIVVQVLSTLCEGKDARLAIDEKTNSIIVAASPEAQQMAADLIKELDVPSEPGAHRELKVFRLKYADPEETAAVVSRIFGKDDARIAVDRRTRSILVEALPDTAQRIDEVLVRLDTEADQDAKKDTPGATLQVRVVWLASELPPDEGVKPADDLKEVVGELSKIGVDGLRQLGQAIVNTMPDGKFQVRCSPLLAGRPAGLEISGILKLRHEMPILNVQLSASQIEPAAVVERGPPSRPTTKRLVDLETTIAAPLGHYVVLGVTPVGKMTSVFILQVTAAKQ
jgi:hypothetical protein